MSNQENTGSVNKKGNELDTKAKTDRRTFVGATAALGTSPSFRYSQASSFILSSETERSPNVLIVFPDQWRNAALGRGNAGWPNGHPNLNTPRLDTFAKTGWQTRNHVTANPVCAPNRAALLTGRHAHASRVIQNNVGGLPNYERTIAEALSDVGYRTGYIGKWHLGPGGMRWKDEGDHGYVPPRSRNGFNDWWEGFTRKGLHEKHHGHFIYDADGNVTVIGENRYQPITQTDRTIGKIDEWEKESEPWFIQVNYNPPHPPLAPPDRYRDRYDVSEITLRPNVPDSERERAREFLADYYALCESVDEQIGRLLDALNQREAASDTLVVFTSDHGELGHSHGRVGKMRMFEESINTPLMMRWGDRLANRQDAPTVVSTTDIAPTVAGLVQFSGRDVRLGRPEHPVQGRDLSDFLLRDEYGGQNATGTLAERAFISGRIGLDQEWRAIRRRRWVLSVDRHLKTEHLYNLWKDPHQQNDLSGQNLEVEQRMRNGLNKMINKYHDRLSRTRR